MDYNTYSVYRFCSIRDNVIRDYAELCNRNNYHSLIPMKHLLLFIICVVYSFASYAGSPTNAEPVKTDKRAIVLHLKPSSKNIHRAPSLDAIALYGYYIDGVLYVDVLDVVDGSTECILTVLDNQVVTTALDLSQGIFIGDVNSCNIEVKIASVGVLIGFLD